MNLKQAQYIKTIAQCGSLTTAAKKLYVSQPSLSQMLRQIEKEIGLPIFDRSVTPLRLTYVGEKYLRAAERMIAANKQLEEELREIKHEHSGRLRLGISATRAMQVLPLVIPIFTEQFPNVTLELTESGSGNLEKLLLEGKIDLAMAALETTSTAMIYELIEKETIGILAGRDSALAKRFPSGTPITIEDAAGDSFVCLNTSHSVRINQDNLFRKKNFSPHILLETDVLEVGLRVALEAGACMLLPNIYVDNYVRQRKGEFFPLKDYDNRRHFYACFRKDEFVPSYIREFIQITTKMLEKEQISNQNFRI